MLLIGIVAVPLCSCAGGFGGVGADDRLQVPTSAAIRGGSEVDSAGLQGVLEGAVSGKRACFWVDGPNGRAFIVLPTGWTADSALAIHDAGGGVVARAGDRRLLAGAPGDPLTPAGCTGDGRPWYTGAILDARPGFDHATLGPIKTPDPVAPESSASPTG